MDAKLSETVTGFKSLLLKMVDPFFRKDGRTVVPLKISGTRGDPQFGLDVRRPCGAAARPHRACACASATFLHALTARGVMLARIGGHDGA